MAKTLIKECDNCGRTLVEKNGARTKGTCPPIIDRVEFQGLIKAKCFFSITFDDMCSDCIVELETLVEETVRKWAT